MSDYNNILKDGREIYIPAWPASVALENLSKAGRYIGADSLIQITQLNISAVLFAITESKDSAKTAGLIKHFICTARIAGDKILESNFDTYFEDNISLTVEVFAHVVAAQYKSFFELGLVKETSQES